MYIIYQFFLFFIIGFLTLFRFFKKKKKDLNLKDRLGISYEASTKPMTIWLHAVSIGETKAIKALYFELKKQYPESYFIVTNQTKTAKKIAKKEFVGADQFRLFVLDFGFIVKRVLKKLKPSLFITSETDLWPVFLKEAKKINCTTVVVNGKISEKSYKRIKMMPFASPMLFNHLDLLLVQSKEYAKRFSDLNIKCPIQVIGNLKCDPLNGVFNPKFDRTLLGLTQKEFVIVIGSTHDPEEKELLKPLKNLISQIANLKVFIVPRHPERFDDVANLLNGFDFVRWSKMDKVPKNTPIILVDQMGVLDSLYSIANISIVAGSFTKKVGGHNILEPIFVKSPTFFGPYMHGQKELETLVLEAKAANQLTIDEIESHIKHLFENKNELKALKTQGETLLKTLSGLSKKTSEIIIERISK